MTVFGFNASWINSVSSGVVRIFSEYSTPTREVCLYRGRVVHGPATEMVRMVTGKILGRAVCLLWINCIALIAGYESQTTRSTTHVEALATHRELVAARRDTQRMQMTAVPGKIRFQLRTQCSPRVGS